MSTRYLADQVAAGTVDMSYIDQTVATVLRTKFALGLFESEILHVHPAIFIPSLYCLSRTDPYPYDDYLSTLRTPETRVLLHQMEQEQIILLENRNNTLPLSKNISSVALIGPQVNRVTVCFSGTPHYCECLHDSTAARRLRLSQRNPQLSHASSGLHRTPRKYLRPDQLRTGLRAMVERRVAVPRSDRSS